MKEQALWIYRNMTRSNRKNLLAMLRETSCAPVAILFYHRIADTHPNDWTMSSRDFSRQLDWLESQFDVVTLSEAQRRIEQGNERPSVSITFDDGYGENAEYAIPELARRGMPATYFVSTDFIEHNLSFPHDVAAGVPLSPNTVEDLREFSRLGIEIGAHTRSHCDLGKVTDPEKASHEILGSIRELENWLDEPMQYFAFPFGLPSNMSQLAVDIMAESNLRGFCSAYGALNWPSQSEYSKTFSSFHLRRIHADTGIERLKNWLTLDSRKLQDETVLPFDESNFLRQHKAEEELK